MNVWRRAMLLASSVHPVTPSSRGISSSKSSCSAAMQRLLCNSPSSRKQQQQQQQQQGVPVPGTAVRSFSTTGLGSPLFELPFSSDRDEACSRQQIAFSTSSAQLAEEGQENKSDDGEFDVQVEKSQDEAGTKVVVRRRNIRGSWKKMNYLTRLVSGLYAMDALEQMAYTKKRKGLIMRNLINLGAVRALQDHDIPIENLVIEEATVGKAMIMKRGRFHARGRVGKNYRRHCHLFLTFREVPRKAEPELPENMTRTSAWSTGLVSSSRAKRRAANAAANAAALGKKLSE